MKLHWTKRAASNGGHHNLVFH